jgi:hypothetical protein
VIFGNRVALANGISARHLAAATNTLILPIQLNAPLSFTNANTNATLVIAGDVGLASHRLTISGGATSNFVGS